MEVSTIVRYKIKKLIKEKKLTIYQLAQYSGIPLSTLKNVIYARSTNAGIDTIYKICNGLNISLAEFFSGDEFANPHHFHEELEQEKQAYFRVLYRKVTKLFKK